MPGFPVLYYVSKFAQTHGHRAHDAIQPSHHLSPPFPPTFNLSQRQGLIQMSRFFSSGGQSDETSSSASVLPVNIQG